MPLFFIIPIAAGAFTLGATTVDVTSDTTAQNRDRMTQTQVQQPQQQPQQQVYRTMAECQQAAVAQGLSANVCQPRQS